MPTKFDYSPTEQALLRIIKSRQRINTTEIMERFYKENPKYRRTLNDRQYINARLSDLVRKVQHNREPFRVERTPRSGPKAMEFWVEPK